MGPKGESTRQKLLSPIKLWFYARKFLPSLNFWKVRVEDLDSNKCTVSLPYRTSTKNPFNSVYFAAMMGAGELSTGALCMIHLADRGSWSMLVTDFNSSFYKKTSEKILFTCQQGKQLSDFLDKIEKSGKPDTMVMESIGQNQSGEKVVKIEVTWSFKKRQV
jgi:acyl-coenzyme A thioesterase PaaI-like protein